MNALFLVPQVGFNETELFTIKRFLEKNNVKCDIASYSKGKVIGKTGKSVVAKQIFCSVVVKDYGCFIVVGGMNVASLIEHKCVVEMINDAYSVGKLIVLLCMAPALFCSVTDILKGKNVTVFKSKDLWGVKNLVQHGVKHVDEPVVFDGNILTCRDEKDSLQLAKTIVEVLKSKK
jgi:protease I